MAVGKKPPIPLIAQREFVATTWSLENGLAEGRHLILCRSVDHEKFPAKTGYWDYVRARIHV